MNTERLLNIVMMDMTMDKMKIEDDIERTINDNNISIEEKTMNVKKLIHRLSTIENSIATFSNMLNNNNTKEKEN